MSARILYIEDNEHNMYLVKFLLEARGHTLLEAWDGRQGVAMALQERPHLVLLDIQLPLMDGYEIARRLRAEPSLAGTPIVALTSYAMTGDREKALAAGCDGYLEKPINPETFVASIERFLPAAL